MTDYQPTWATLILVAVTALMIGAQVEKHYGTPCAPVVVVR